jgi:hypothetical protein
MTCGVQLLESIVYGPLPTGFGTVSVTGFLTFVQMCFGTMGVWSAT